MTKSRFKEARTDFPEIVEKRKYSILPSRAVMDRSLDEMALRVLGCICIHTNSHGIAWPTRETIGRYIGHHPNSVGPAAARLIDRGYLRKLSPRKFKVERRGSKYPINRYQVLFEGKATPLPTLEQFYAPKPRAIEEQDGTPDGRVSEQTGSSRERSRVSVSLASAFCRAVERSSGERRQPERQAEEAERLAGLGIEPEKVAEATERAVLEALKVRRSTPQTLRQVSEIEGW
jgi:hypothetical protein